MQPGEAIVWQAKPRYRKWGLPFIVLVTVFVITWGYFVEPQSLLPNLQGVLFVFGILNLGQVYIFSKYAGVSYYITDRRVARGQELLIFRRIQEIPYASIARIWARRRLGRNTIVFQARDSSTLTFSNFDEDALKVRESVERAMISGRQSAF